MNYANSLTLNESSANLSYSRVNCDISYDERMKAKARKEISNNAWDIVERVNPSIYGYNGQEYYLKAAL